MHPIYAEMDHEPAPAGAATCRRCGCWHWNACWHEALGACWWVEDDLCSHCAVRDWRLVAINRRALRRAAGFEDDARARALREIVEAVEAEEARAA